MSIILAKTNRYGPATLDIQIEQGGDLIIPLTLMVSGTPWILTGATFESYMSPSWYPGVNGKIPFTVDILDVNAGSIKITYPGASSLALALPNSPRKEVTPRQFELGGWLLKITQNSSPKILVQGKVWLDRDPCLT